MNLRSIFASTALEILYSKKVIALLYLFLGFMILTHMVLSAFQFATAYYNLGEFDVPPGEFYAITAFFFLPLWLTSALIFRALIQRMRLVYWTKQMQIVPEYEIYLTPAEAGYLVDFEYNHRELIATMLDLWFRGVVDIVLQDDDKIKITQANIATTHNKYEQWLIKWIFISGKEIIMSSFSDRRLVDAANKAHVQLIDQYNIFNLSQEEKYGQEKFKKLFKIIYRVGGIIGILAMIAFVVDPEASLGINYPRYAVEPGQLLALVSCMAIFIFVVASGMWPKFDVNRKSQGSKMWMRAAGFQLYERVVNIDRYSNHFAYTSGTDLLKSYIAYAIVFGIYEPDDRQIKSLIKLLSAN